MESKIGVLRIGIPTGRGTNGVRKEAVEIAKAMLTQMGAKYIHQRWCKYYILEPEFSETLYFTRLSWGTVLTAEVPDLEYAQGIMQSFEYDIVDKVAGEENVKVPNYWQVNQRSMF
jgi:hypothetical protein